MNMANLCGDFYHLLIVVTAVEKVVDVMVIFHGLCGGGILLLETISVSVPYELCDGAQFMPNVSASIV